MKKLLFSVAILAVAASCSKNEVPDAAPAAESAISFATLNNLARSANDAADQYQVYAAQEGVTNAWYIADYSKSEDDESLTNTYYWPTDESTLDFYAYAPYTAGTPSVTPSTVISIEYTVPTTADEDFTIAEPITGLTSTSTEYTAPGAVAFKFSHQLSKATVAVVLSTELLSAGYTLTMDEEVEYAAAVYQEGYDADNDPDGDYLVSAEVEAQDAATVTLGVFGKTATYDVMGITDINYGTIPEELTTYTKDYLTTTTTTTVEDEETVTETTDNYFIFMPQSAVDCTIYVTGVTIKDPSQKVIAKSIALGTYTITENDLKSFNENTYYAITLTIDNATIDDDEEEIFGDAIKFTATTLAWDEETLGLGSANQASSEDEN